MSLNKTKITANLKTAYQERSENISEF